MSELVRHFDEIGFSVVAKVKEVDGFAGSVDFVAYEIDATIDGQRMWHRKDSPSSPDPVASIEEAEPYLSGSVKWDGCSNWHFDEQERAMLHGCSREDLTRLGEVMALCWDWAAELLLNWDA